MGAWVSSAPNWDHPERPGYDMYGVVPDGMKPSQHLWNQFYLDNKAPKALSSNPSQTMVPGQTNDILQSFGRQNDLIAPHEMTWYQLINGAAHAQGPITTKYDNTIPPQGKELRQFAWAQLGQDTWMPNEQTCNPTNYPDCSMQSMRLNAAQLQPHDNWWAETNVDWKSVKFQGNQPWVLPNITPPDGAKMIDTFTRYADILEPQTENYAAGNLQALRELNSRDTSSFDPCVDPIGLEALLPVATGFVFLVIQESFLSEVLSQLPTPGNFAVRATFPAAGYYLGKAGAASIKIEGNVPLDPSEEDRQLEIGASLLATGVAAAAGSYVANHYLTPQFGPNAEIAGTVVAAEFGRQYVQPIFAGFMTTTSFVLDIALLPAQLFNYIAHWWCNLANRDVTACNEFLKTGESEYDDVRMWDVSSLAARLTDIACGVEGWERESPQAKFVFKSLITNPSFMQAATLPANMPGMYKGTVNPIGQIAPIHDVVKTDLYMDSVPTKQKNNGFVQQWSSAYSDISGNSAVPWESGQQDHNRFACQNFDILYNADECDEMGGDKEQPSCASNPAAEGEDKLFAKNLKTWLKAAVKAAKNPNNFQKQNLIPGLNADPMLRPLIIDVQRYLETAGDDFDGKVGFDYVLHRGQWAYNYLADNSNRVEPGTLEEIQVIANSYFTLPNEREALNRAKQSGDFSQRNLVALVHYWHGPKGDLQLDDFDLNWRVREDREIDKLLLEPDLGFVPFDDPFQRIDYPMKPLQPHGSSKGFDPLQPLPKPIPTSPKGSRKGFCPTEPILHDPFKTTTPGDCYSMMASVAGVGSLWARGAQAKQVVHGGQCAEGSDDWFRWNDQFYTWLSNSTNPNWSIVSLGQNAANYQPIFGFANPPGEELQSQILWAITSYDPKVDTPWFTTLWHEWTPQLDSIRASYPKPESYWLPCYKE